MELIHQDDRERLAELIADDRRAVRPVMARLWDPDADIRSRAARALGRAAAVHPDLGLEIIRNLMWALNDESATNGVYGLPALGEIGFWAPELIAGFVQPIASLSWDEGLRPEIVNALQRIGEAAPELIEPCRSILEETRAGGELDAEEEPDSIGDRDSGSRDGA